MLLELVRIRHFLLVLDTAGASAASIAILVGYIMIHSFVREAKFCLPPLDLLRAVPIMPVSCVHF